jgi:hypothetical protein
MEKTMTSTIYRLNHYHPLSIAQPVDRVSFDGKTIGNFSTPEHVARAHAAVAGQEGFRDWPDGFRLLEIPLDHDFFVEGFILHAEGDIAIAGEGSGDVGNDTEVEEYGSVPPPNTQKSRCWETPLWPSGRHPEDYGNSRISRSAHGVSNAILNSVRR